MAYLEKVPGSNPAPMNWPEAESCAGTYNGLMLTPNQMVSDTQKEIDRRHTGAPVEEKAESVALDLAGGGR
jgi:hypothetical protein